MLAWDSGENWIWKSDSELKRPNFAALGVRRGHSLNPPTKKPISSNIGSARTCMFYAGKNHAIHPTREQRELPRHRPIVTRFEFRPEFWFLPKLFERPEQPSIFFLYARLDLSPPCSPPLREIAWCFLNAEIGRRKKMKEESCNR